MNTDERGYFDALTERVLGAVFEVSTTLGAGFLEKVYQRALMRSAVFHLPLVVRDRSEFHELNRRTVINDHRYCQTWAGTVRFNQDFLAFECPSKVIHFKSNVR